MKIAVLGCGVSGRAAARLAEVLHHETVMLEDGGDYGREIASVDMFVCSPGIRPDSPLYRSAAASGKPFTGEMEFGFRCWPGRVAAITGTDGKTTATELTVHILNALNVKAVAAGNIGRPLSDVAADLLTGELAFTTVPVIETSSFQLERVESFSPAAAVLLNVGCDHLDRYPGGMAEYESVKRRIFRGVPMENRIFGRSMNEPGFVPHLTCDGQAILLGGEFLLDFSRTRLHGGHNMENLLAALELTLRFTSPEALKSSACIDAVCSFQPGRHRIEHVADIGGVRYINDSKATNPHAASASIMAFERIHLLIGGLDKGMEFGELKKFAGRIKKAYVFGQCRDKIMESLRPEIECVSFGMDFGKALQAAADNADAGDTVLLAPACASMDMFKNYQERGECFCQAVKNLAK